MKNQTLEIKAALQILKPVNEVFEAIIDPTQMSNYFISKGSGLHAVGTVALGGAIAMAGQIFNMQEHWPSAVLLWAVGAIAGWLLLGDWPHLALTAILAP